jgi:hypothetical protein
MDFGLPNSSRARRAQPLGTVAQRGGTFFSRAAGNQVISLRLSEIKALQSTLGTVIAMRVG